MDKRFSCLLDEDLLEWVKDYQHTLLICSGEVVTVQDIIQGAIELYKDSIPLKIQKRPDFLKEKDSEVAKKISAARRSGTTSKDVKKT